MRETKVTVVDYGLGNLYSVQRALETCGAHVSVTSVPEEIEAAERLVLPGVGAFADGMQGLYERELVEPLRKYAGTGRPLLGICLGMQMLATASEEFGEHAGLSFIPGRVVAIADKTVDGRPHKIPHIGWTSLMPAAGTQWSGTPLEETVTGTPVYLVHSYHVVPRDPVHLLAECEYGGHRITAAICTGKIFGFQFHPEKSGPAGLAILRRFLSR